jgi:NAD(P)-dependent dehydrogenase (short-subunit alcohol dehydrogenase family)
MQDLAGKVAVVTGGGHGIGSGICHCLAAAGMHVAVADIDQPAAESVAASLRDHAAKSIAVRVDVSDRNSVEQLAETAQRELGGIHVVCNNAGVLVGGPMAEMTDADWQWLWSVNLMGIVHGSQVFAPILVEQGDGHIVNTASVGGFLAYPLMAIYCATKFAVIGYSDALRMELAPKGIGVSILCPGKVRTNLAEADRLRPIGLGRAGGSSKVLSGGIEDGMDPQRVGDCVVRGIRENAAYVFTHPEFRERLQAHFGHILEAFGSKEPK